jgi:uncharacterized protein (TIGR02646 family)
MLQLDLQLSPPRELQSELDHLQAKIDTEPEFEKRCEKAQSTWKNKSKSTAEQLIDRLRELSSLKWHCHYCEDNEDSDIEHICPKSFFPEKTFVWENYLLACKLCNSGYKLDHCFLIDENGNLAKLPRKQRPQQDAQHAFINPRSENPNDLLLLNLQTFTFHNIAQPGSIEWHRVEKTLEILQLNNRDKLIRSRKAAAIQCYDLMDRLCRILRATTHSEVERLLHPDFEPIDHSKELSIIQSEISQSFRDFLLSQRHPAVWHAIKVVASKTEPKWQEIFNQIPEALSW